MDLQLPGRVVAPDGGAPRPSAPLVGRTDELAALTDAAARAQAGAGRVVLVRGETGIGKSRLLAELSQWAADRGMAVLAGRSVPGGGAYRPVAEALVGRLRSGPPVDPAALGPYRAILARLLPDWGARAAPEPGADPGVVLGEAVARFLAVAGRSGGCLLVLEDLHWADADTLAVVAYLCEAVRTLPVLVAASARNDAGAPALGLLARTPALVTLLLHPLPDDAVAALVHRLRDRPVDDATLRLVIRRAEGVPFLVEELLSGVDDPAARVPPSFADLVAERLATLAEGQREVLAAAAVVGSASDAPLLAETTGRSEDDVIAALRAATAASLLAVDGTELRWRHALTRETVLAGLLPPERAVLARRAARALLARRGEEDETAAAALLLDAGAAAEATDLMLQLARSDLARGALRTAEQLLDRIATTGLRPAAAAGERVRLLTLTGRAADALTVGAPLLDRTAGAESAELALRLARAAIEAGRWADAQRFVERAARPDDPRSAALLADAAHGAGRVDEAVRHADAAVALAEAAGSAEDLCDALLIAAKLARLTDPDRAAATFRRAARVAGDEQLTAAWIEALIGQGTVELLRDPTSAILPTARALALESGLLGQAVGIDLMQLDALLLATGPHGAAEPARVLVEQAHRLGIAPAEVAGRYVLALAAAQAARRAEVERHLSDWAALLTAGPEAPLKAASVRAHLALAGHDLPAATALLDDAIGPVLPHASAAPLHEFGLWALLRTVVGDRDEPARATLRALPAVLRRANRAALTFAEAVAAGRAGRPQEAGTLFAEAEAELAGQPWLRRVLRLLALESAVGDGWGDPVPLLRAALAEHERFGEEASARTCRDLLRRAGAPTRRGRGTATVPSGLARLGVTTREMDVLVLLADGATNAEIAARLFLSSRTVETHVANLMLKTGAGSRHDLGRLAQRELR